MLLKFGFDIIKRNKIMSISIIIQIVISTVLLNYSLGLYNNVSLRYNVIKGFDVNKTLYYMPRDYVSDEELTRIINIDKDYTIEPVIYCGFVNQKDNINIYANAYGNNTSSKLHLEMVSGVWYEDCPKEDGIVNVVAYEGTDFAVGDIYETSLFSHEEKERNKVKLKITGIVNRNVGVITGLMGSNHLQIDHFFEDVNFSSVRTNNWFLFNYTDLSGIENITDELSMMPNYFIYSNTDDNSEYITELSKTGDIISMQSMIDNSSESLAEKLHTVYPVAAGVLFSGVLGAECLIILNNLRNRKRFAIYYICGMKWNDCIKISVTQLSYLIAAAFPLTCIAFAVMFNFNIMSFNEITLFDTSNVIVTVGVILLMYFISVVSSKLMVSGSAPKDYLKD